MFQVDRLVSIIAKLHIIEIFAQRGLRCGGVDRRNLGNRKRLVARSSCRIDTVKRFERVRSSGCRLGKKGKMTVVLSRATAGEIRKKVIHRARIDGVSDRIEQAQRILVALELEVAVKRSALFVCLGLSGKVNHKVLSAFNRHVRERPFLLIGFVVGKIVARKRHMAVPGIIQLNKADKLAVLVHHGAVGGGGIFVNENCLAVGGVVFCGFFGCFVFFFGYGVCLARSRGRQNDHLLVFVNAHALIFIELYKIDTVDKPSLGVVQQYAFPRRGA